MKKFEAVMTEIYKLISETKVDGKINRTQINDIVDQVCEKMNFKGNEFSVFLRLGMA